MAPRTIDNLGYDASQRYAYDQNELADVEKIHKDFRIPLSHAQIDVTTPSFNSEVDILFQADKKHLAWAEFSPPHGFSTLKNRFFTYQILPSLAIPEESENYTKKIHALTEEKEENSENKPEWEMVKEAEEKTKEKSALLNLLDCILNLNSCMIYLNNKRTQYHKG